MRFLKLFLSLDPHILKVVHHFDFLLECGHLNLDLNALLL